MTDSQVVRGTSAELAALYQSVEAFCDLVSQLVNDIWLEDHRRAIHVHAIDFQELHALMYPFGDPKSRSRPFDEVSPDDEVARRALLEFDGPFVILEGTRYELALHLLSIEEDVIATTRRRGQRSRTLRNFVDDVQNRVDGSSAELTLQAESPIEWSDTAARFESYEQALVRLVAFLEKPSRFDLREKLGEATLRLPRAQFNEALNAVSYARHQRKVDRSNYADALNLGSVVFLNHLLNRRFQQEALDSRFIVHLLTHTPTLFRLPHDFQLALYLKIAGRKTNLLRTPIAVLLERFIRLEYPQAEGKWLFSAVDKLRLEGEQAKAAVNWISYELSEDDTTLSGFLRQLASPHTDRPEFREFFTKVTSFLNRGPFRSAIGTLRSAEILVDSLPGRSFKPGVTRPSDEPNVMRTVFRVSDLLRRVEFALRPADLTIDSREAEIGYTDRPYHFFAAEHLGYVRSKDGFKDPEFERIQYELLDRHETPVLSIDRYQDFYVASWATACSAREFVTAVDELLNSVDYAAAETHLSLEEQGVCLIDSQGDLDSRELKLPLDFDELAEEGGPPSLVRINTSLGAFCWEPANDHSGRTGVVSHLPLFDLIATFHESVGGRLPSETMIAELQVVQRRGNREFGRANLGRDFDFLERA